MPRNVEEWIGKTDDAAVPERVKLRIWHAQDGICGICHRKIQPGDKKHLHHTKALILGGQHREKNLTWSHAACNAEEAKTEVAIRAATDAKAKKHIGIKSAPARGLPGRSRDEITADRAKRSTGKPSLPARSLYVEA